MFFFDPMYFVFLGPAILLTLWAQWRVKSTYAKYENVPNHQRLVGAQAARYILDSQGLNYVPVQEVPGDLSDHYDPTKKVLNLSSGVYRSNSIAAMAIAAHEAGHAVQHAQGYAPMKVRTAIVPIVALGANIGPMMIMVSIMLYLFFHFTGATWLIWGGIALFSMSAIFSLVTLPVELNASSRAMQLLTNGGLIDRTEYGQARQMLNAAALTYVAGLTTAVLQLLYYISIAAGLGDRRR